MSAMNDAIRRMSGRLASESNDAAARVFGGRFRRGYEYDLDKLNEIQARTTPGTRSHELTKIAIDRARSERGLVDG